MMMYYNHNNNKTKRILLLHLHSLHLQPMIPWLWSLVWTKVTGVHVSVQNHVLSCNLFLICTKCPWKHLAEINMWGSWTSTHTSRFHTIWYYGTYERTVLISEQIFRPWSHQRITIIRHATHIYRMKACRFLLWCAQVFSTDQLSFEMHPGVSFFVQTPSFHWATISLC